MKIKWFDKPQRHDYPAAASYLNLTKNRDEAEAIAEKLKLTEMTEFAAKDIFRASDLSLLGVSNSHVEQDTAQIIRGEKLSPLLLYRDRVNDRLVIANGYHRLCAVYKFDEDAMIPCKIV
jgi:predicted nucleic acid-binding protein